MPEWIPYETDDEPALEVSIDVDLDDDTAFRQGHPYRVTVTASRFAADADGQPNDTTADALFDLEQRVDALCNTNDAALACTVSGDGSYEMIAYAASTDFAQTLRQTLTDVPFALEIEGVRDDEWDEYAEYALRGDVLENARDADLLMQMQEAGDDLTRDYVVTFEWSLDNLAHFESAASALRNAGYDVPREIYDDILAADETMALTEENLEQTRKAMAKTLAPFNAHYEGWEAELVDDED